MPTADRDDTANPHDTSLSWWERLRTHFSAKGRCKNCGAAWDVRERGPDIKYAEGSWAFPVCQQCFDALDADEITSWFKTMWLLDWGRDEDRIAFRVFRENAKELKQDHGR